MTFNLQFFGISKVGQLQIDYCVQHGANRRKCSNEQIFYIPPTFPPLPEQKAIAAYLDDKTTKIDRLLQAKRRQIALLKEERTALINQAVTRGLDPEVPLKDSGVEWIGKIPKHWEVKKLKYCLSKMEGGGTPSTDNSEYWDGNIPWLSSKDLKVEKEIFSGEDFITELAISKSSTTLISPGAILVVTRSGILRHTLPLAITGAFVAINQDIRALTPRDWIKVEFLFWFLKGNQTRILDDCVKQGATVESVEMGVFEQVFVMIPPLNEQFAIIQKIEESERDTSNLLSKIEKEIDLLQEYRTALISEVVTGKVRIHPN